MISMPYDPHCETIRFVWRKARFVFAAFWPNRGPKRNGLRGGRASADLSWARGRRASKGPSLDGQGAPRSPDRFARNDANARPPSPFLWVSFRGVQLTADP